MRCTNCGTMLEPGSSFCGACGTRLAPPPPWQPQPSYPPPQAWQQPPMPGQPYPSPPMAAPLTPHPLIMQQRLTRLTGQMFVAPQRLYFICESNKGGLAVAIGKGVGGLIGGAIAAFGAPAPGQAAPIFDEPTLGRAAQEREGSLVMEPQQLKAIKCTMWTRGIFFNGKTYALPNGLDKALRLELGRWCKAHDVKHAGLDK